MKKILSLLLLTTVGAFAQMKTSDRAELAFKNRQPNPGFEQGGTRGLAAPGNGATIALTTTAANVHSGRGALAINVASATTTITQFLGNATIPVGDGACLAEFYYKGFGTQQIRFQVADGSGNYVAGNTFSGSDTNFATSTAASDWTKIDIPFSCPASGVQAQIVIQLIQGAAIGYIDDVYVGADFRVGNGVISTAPVAYTPTFTGFGTVTGINFVSWRIGPMLHIQGTFTPGTTTATEAQITLGYSGVSGNVTSSANLPTLQMVGRMNVNASATTDFGGRTVLEEASKTYMTFGNETSTRNGLTKYAGNVLVTTGQTSSLVAEIPIAGWDSSGGFTVTGNAAGIQWTSFAPTIAAWSTNTTSTGSFRCDGDTLQVQYNIALSGAPTGSLSSLTLPSGFTIDTAKLLGGAANQLKCTGSTKSNGNAGIPVVCEVASSTTLQPTVLNASGTYLTDASITNTIPATYKSGDYVYVSAEGIPVLPNPQCNVLRAPVVPSSVFSPSIGVENIARAHITNSGSCVVASQSGSTGTFISSISRPGTGQCTLNFVSGNWTTAPSCICTAAGGEYCRLNAAATTSAVTTVTVTVASTNTDADYDIICMGAH